MAVAQPNLSLNFLKQDTGISPFNFIPKALVGSESGSLGVQKEISVEMLMSYSGGYEEILEMTWADLMKELGFEYMMVLASLSPELYSLVRLRKEAFYNHVPPYGPSLKLILILEVFKTIAKAVEHTPHFVPEFRYETPTSGSIPRPIEWRCGHCQVPNPIDNVKCESCGAPRYLLIQEM